MSWCINRDKSSKDGARTVVLWEGRTNMASIIKPFWQPPPLLLMTKELVFRQWCKVGAHQKIRERSHFQLEDPKSWRGSQQQFKDTCFFLKNKPKRILKTKIYSSWIIWNTTSFDNESSKFHVPGINFNTMMACIIVLY